MIKDNQNELDAVLFELNDESDRHYRLIQPEPPLTNRQFFLNFCIGIAIWAGIPLLIAFGFCFFNR
jgi:hypothetical protein